MGVDILKIGVSGLSAAQRQLMTTSHNVSNVNTEGYSRQRAEQAATLPAYYTGTGFIGTGVTVQTTVRMSDEFLESQVRETNSNYGQYSAFYDLSAQIDNLLANPDTGLTPTLESFYSALQEANDDPSSTSTRQILLSEANVLTDRFQLINDRFVDLNNEVNERISNITSEISSLASNIASFNVEIIRLTGIGNGNTPNDILDQREVLIKELAKKIDISVVYQDDGAANIFIGSGQSLVLSGNAATMSSEINKYNSLQQDIILTRGNAKEHISDSVTGGELEGILNFREEVLYPSINSLGRIAIALSEEMNAQHRLGMTLQGTTEPFPLGGDFFTDLAGTPQVLNGQINSTGSYTAEIVDSKALTTSDYQLDVTAAVPPNYQLTRLSDNSILYSGADLDELKNAALSQGFLISETSISAVDETFLIRPTAAAAANIGVYVNNVLDIALASPIIAGEASSETGGAVNSGSGSISLPTNTAADNIPITDAAGNLVEIILTYNNTLKQFDITTIPAASPPLSGSIKFDNTVPDDIHGLATQLPGSDYNNIQFTLSGIPNDGDKFVIKNNISPYDDNRNGLLMAALQTAKTLENGSSDFQGAYAVLVADVGTKTHVAEVDLKAQTTILQEANARRESYSGVNLDEEAALLLKYQQAYQASSKVIVSASKMFQDLLNAV